jgi:N-acetyl-gamma-glutamyl-phosphate reductase
MNNIIKIGIVGGAGYTGGELIRLLLIHPTIEIVFIHSNSNAGKKIHTVHQDLLGQTQLVFTNSIDEQSNIDLLFLCLGHGDSMKFLTENNIDPTIKIIDVANDFRLHQHANFKNRQFVYGLPELNKKAIQSAQNIANPGCFATAIQLGLLPLAKAGLLQTAYATGITGSTGAGQSLSATSHFSWRANNIQAYKTLTHQHNAEIIQSLNAINPTNNLQQDDVHFVPWRGDFTRGIFVSTQVKCDVALSELNKLFEDFYAAHPFTQVSTEAIFLKQVVNTNYCFIQLEKQGNNLVVHSIIDNLLKGAVGQAVQNMNLLFNLPETTGLQLKANYF